MENRIYVIKTYAKYGYQLCKEREYATKEEALEKFRGFFQIDIIDDYMHVDLWEIDFDDHEERLLATATLPPRF